MTGKQKRRLVRILAALALFIAAWVIGGVLELRYLWGIALMAVPYLTAGYDVLFEAFRKLFTGQVFDESLLMTVASLGAMALCFIEKDAHSAHEAAAIMIFYQVGELFQSIAVGRSRKSVKDLLSMMPDEAHVERGGETVTVDPEEVQTGEILAVLPGERIPIDGVVIEGQSSLDTASLTGESLPKDAAEGAEVLSGCINLTGKLRIRTTKPFAQSTASKIMELVENAGAQKSKSERFISSFSRVYTPLVTLAALLTAVVPSLIVGVTSGNWAFADTWRPFVHAGLMFLIVSCPCALVISVPLGFFASIGAAGKRGVLIKGSAFVEALSKTETAVFDKTGTLTRGTFSVTRIDAVKTGEEELLRLAAAAERWSTHPLARAVCAAYEGELPEASGVTELPGRGICALVDGKKIHVGNMRLMREIGAEAAGAGTEAEQEGSAVYVAREGEYLGCITAQDSPKSDSAAAIRELKAMGVRCVMLTGDRQENAERIGRELGLDEFKAGLLPEDKVTHTQELMKTKSAGGKVVFVGDGINDAPVLALSDVGVAMGALGSDAAIEAADVVLAGDRPSDLPFALRLCRKAMRLIKENIVFALGVKLAVLILLLLMTFVPALSGLNEYAGEFAVFADVGVSVLAILNAMRCSSGTKRRDLSKN